jgi:hypothetical protein
MNDRIELPQAAVAQVLDPAYQAAEKGVWRFFRDPNVPGINQAFRRKMSLTPFSAAC